VCVCVCVCVCVTTHTHTLTHIRKTPIKSSPQNELVHNPSQLGRLGLSPLALLVCRVGLATPQDGALVLTAEISFGAQQPRIAKVNLKMHKNKIEISDRRVRCTVTSRPGLQK